MDQHNLKQADLSDLVAQGNLSAILHGKRSISKSLAISLAKKFAVEVSVFLEEENKRSSLTNDSRHLQA